MGRDPQGLSIIKKETFMQVILRMEKDFKKIDLKKSYWSTIIEYFTKRGTPVGTLYDERKLAQAYKKLAEALTNDQQLN